MLHILESEMHLLVGMISYANMGWGLHFTKGQRLDEDFDDGGLCVELERKPKRLPDYFELSATPVVSERFAERIRGVSPDNYQLFPAPIKMPKQEVMGHYILNVVGLESCIDENASDTKNYKGSIMRMNHLVLKQGFNSSRELFRCPEFPLAIFISDTLREALEYTVLTGCRISPAEGWSDKHRF